MQLCIKNFLQNLKKNVGRKRFKNSEYIEYEFEVFFCFKVLFIIYKTGCWIFFLVALSRDIADFEKKVGNKLNNLSFVNIVATEKLNKGLRRKLQNYDE